LQARRKVHLRNGPEENSELVAIALLVHIRADELNDVLMALFWDLAEDPDLIPLMICKASGVSALHRKCDSIERGFVNDANAAAAKSSAGDE
jgi:hypothetical protein